MDGQWLRPRCRGSARLVRLFAIDPMEHGASVEAPQAVAIHGIELGHAKSILAAWIVFVQVRARVSKRWIGGIRHGNSIHPRSTEIAVGHHFSDFAPLEMILGGGFSRIQPL
jgi:hypothetical protein